MDARTIALAVPFFVYERFRVAPPSPASIDRNYAGILMVWDRLFGTFQREEREPVHGTVEWARLAAAAALAAWLARGTPAFALVLAGALAAALAFSLWVARYRGRRPPPAEPALIPSGAAGAPMG